MIAVNTAMMPTAPSPEAGIRLLRRSETIPTATGKVRAARRARRRDRFLAKKVRTHETGRSDNWVKDVMRTMQSNHISVPKLLKIRARHALDTIIVPAVTCRQEQFLQHASLVLAPSLELH
jgi:hypothetical protein